MEYGLSQADAAFESLGKGLDGLFQDAIQLETADHIVEPPAPVLAHHPANVGDEIQKRAGRHFPIAGGAFRKIAEGALSLQGLAFHVETANLGGARGGRQKAGDHLHGGRFACAVWPKKTEHLPGFGAEGNTGYGGHGAVALAEHGGFDHRR
ncbi:MAG: hypothetical protein H6R26_3213, partial [Proteobacteria bacterium]|nr:hypothetical protein [Pseudomonadota bacterium]